MQSGSVTKKNTLTVISDEPNPVFARTDVQYKARLIEGALAYHGLHAVFSEGLPYVERPILAVPRYCTETNGVFSMFPPKSLQSAA